MQETWHLVCSWLEGDRVTRAKERLWTFPEVKRRHSAGCRLEDKELKVGEESADCAVVNW
jgi:hypothetical protein